jgi:hypothetical protein
MNHELKTWPQSFDPTWRGEKRAEFRVADRQFDTGDILILREWVPGRGGGEGAYTGRAIEALVTHVLRGPDFGIPEGYAMLSIKSHALIEDKVS